MEEKDNPFLKRKEISISISHPKASTPKKADIIKEYSGKYSVPEDQVIVDYIQTKKGSNESIAKLKIYSEKPKTKEKKVEKKEVEKSEAPASEAK